jgi:hypothetical protein
MGKKHLTKSDQALLTKAYIGLQRLQSGCDLTSEDKAALTHLATVTEPRHPRISTRSVESGPDTKGQRLDRKI